MARVNSWGRLASFDHDIQTPSSRREAAQIVLNSVSPSLPFGMGRSYGDICLNAGGGLWANKRLDRYISFDASTGTLTCEAGVLLKDIQRMMQPRGWMLPVMPGTQIVTVGGAIANDVHGKNHHIRGSFGNSIKKLTLLRTDGDVIECSPSDSSDWFSATVGGMGLTGWITSATLQLIPVSSPWVYVESIPYRSLDEFVTLADESEDEWEYTVSWLDCLSPTGRGIFLRGKHIEDIPRTYDLSREFSITHTPPFSLVNKLSLRAFNSLYFNLKSSKSGGRIESIEAFQYPLDRIHHWNRLYGKRGFYQYQFVLPRSVGIEPMKSILDLISSSHQGSFLAVLKTFGKKKAPGMMSFPRSGLTLALDFSE